MPKIRVLVVDDAVVVRSRVSKILSHDAELEVVDVAANGRIALAKIPYVNPDVIILDVEMPDLNGLETLAAIRQSYPQLPVIMFSTSTRIGATATLEALSLGASDYATKPSNLGSMEATTKHIREELIPKIKLFGAGISVVSPAITVNHADVPPQRPKIEQIDVIAIGVSTGGPNALAQILPELPGNLAVPILIVQHMPPMFTKLLAERLASKCQIAVDEAIPGAVLEPGKAWIAPGDFHMVVQRHGNMVRIDTHKDPPENSCRPAVDVLLRSVAEVYGGRSLAVILTGMGQDGLQGCQHIREVGGKILAQDKASSVVWGMPGFVVNAGLADQIVPLDQMAGEIMRRVRYNQVPILGL
ncbi:MULTISPECIES: protein-glutamate methylesterase/protein-glutamine glutaminase [unclassified Tolypothrix]|nr:MULTISPECIES: chemotaxis response regulator protein-glutamate methylesterase [unclassified Tolypothrix]MBE9085146.1 chemotaxis response regulator protein-glutamate methylesterase [Tolypothrix sp. LEGE 11397]BAY94878.1 response regulator receiver modulated CheB methylesterase [Microchaete diplosiphon NIES-3275]EKF00922.1 protein-glutamate methylesterase [Tolypothrix sp. PCC 7601]UYD28523.1 chemotaxis response regulator protein-glutamate methylesterase [Tolypothrix sp. PCC 7712]UYD35564.1 che